MVEDFTTVHTFAVLPALQLAREFSYRSNHGTYTALYLCNTGCHSRMRKQRGVLLVMDEVNKSERTNSPVGSMA